MVSRLNFNIIDTHDPKTLGIVDTSWYNPDIVIEESKIEIIPPGFSHVASPFFMVKALNVYNSNGVGIGRASCEDQLSDLPDGLWRIKYSICPNDQLFIEKMFLKTDRIQCRYTQTFLSLDLSGNNEISEKDSRVALEKIDFFMRGAVAASNNQNPKLAMDLYNKANNFLDDFGNCRF